MSNKYSLLEVVVLEMVVQLALDSCDIWLEIPYDIIYVYGRLQEKITYVWLYNYCLNMYVYLIMQHTKQHFNNIMFNF